MPSFVPTSAETLEDQRLYTTARLVEVACLDCLARVGVKKNSEHHTSIQWTASARAACPELSRRPSGRESHPACPRLAASIEQAVQTSYELLDDDQRRCFRRLALMEHPVSLDVLADISGVTRAEAAQLASALARRSLVEVHSDGRFDMLVPKDRFFTKPMQNVLSVVGSREFRERVSALGGYEVAESGRIVSPT